MGNQNGKLVVDGEKYTEAKVRHMMKQLRDELELLKVFQLVSTLN